MISSTLEKHQNKVKNHILSISIAEIKNSFKYYFNIFTNAENAEFNRKFSKNYNEIKNIINRTPGLLDAKKDDMISKLNLIKGKFAKQLNYIKNFEEDILNGKIKPSANNIDIIKIK